MGFELSSIVLNDLFTVTMSEQELLEIKTTIEKETIDSEIRKISKPDLNDSEILKKLDGAEPITQTNSYESWTNYWAPSESAKTETSNTYYSKEAMSPKECSIKYEFYDQMEEAKQEVTNARISHLTGNSTEVMIGTTVVYSSNKKFKPNSAKEEQDKLWRLMNHHWTCILYQWY